MFRPQSVLVLLIITILTFFVSTIYLLLNLQSTDIEVRNIQTIEDKIYHELKNLPEHYKSKSFFTVSVLDSFVNNIRNTTFEFESTNLKHLWEEANSWVSKNQIVDFTNVQIGQLLTALRNAAIIKADLDTRGTQLKLLLTLQENQQVIFKPKWYEKEKIIEGPVYAGKDRYGSEILGFYLSVILNKPFTPISVERSINLKKEVLPVATEKLLETSFTADNKSCIYGKCFFCKKEDPLCENDNSDTTGAVIFNIKATLANHRSPWQRTYKKGKKAMWQAFPETYCRVVKERISKRRLYDLIDLSIFDFLIQNGDRHHYETLSETVIWLDNGKGLGNPFIHHLDILAPLYQCCVLRKQTLKNLLKLSGGQLKERLLLMPNLLNVVSPDHLEAIEKRLLIIFATVEYCKKQKDSS